MSKKNKKKFDSKSKLLILLMLLVMSVGFALLSSNLSFNGNFNVKGNKWDIHFDNLVEGESTIVPTSKAVIDTDDNTKINFSINLDKPLDSYSFKVDVVNAGTINAIVEELELSGLDEAYSDYIDFDVTLLKSGDIISANSSKPVNVKIAFKDVDNLPTSYDNNVFNLSVSIKVSQTQIRDLPTTTSALDADAVQSLLNDSNSTFENVIVTPDGIPKGSDVITGFISRAFMMGVGADRTYVDVSANHDGSIVMWTEGGNLYLGAAEEGYKVKAPADCTGLFSSYEFYAMQTRMIYSAIDVSYLDVSEVEDMSYMFAGSAEGRLPEFLLGQGDSLHHGTDGIGTGVGTNVPHADVNVPIIGLETWDVSNVKRMDGMFSDSFRFCTEPDLSGIEFWDVSNVENMNSMFMGAFAHATKVTLNLNKWDTSNVKTMIGMFTEMAKFDSTSITLNISKWDTSNVENIGSMFSFIGYSEAEDVSCNKDERPRDTLVIKMDLSRWNTSNVTGMNDFMSFKNPHTNVVIDGNVNLSNWDVSKVTSHLYFSDYDEVIQPNWTI